MKLHLAEGLNLPVDFATQTLLVVGKRGSGKSNTAVRLAEQLFAAQIPFVAVDPVDNWWGLKSSKDGSAPGLPVTIFGGSHADVPLEATGGALVADVIVESRVSAVLSIRHFSNRDRARFVADLFDRLYRTNREPLHVFLEEAHEVAPQSPFKGDEEMLGRVTRLWKLGRSSGLGGSAITQRPASLSKNITTQAEILIVHRLIGPQDVAAIKEWIKYHGESESILAELSTLQTGEAFLWAPDFPEGTPIGLRRVRILQRETFDSAATPRAGQVRREPRVLASPDLESLRERMAATIERAKADDPRELRKRIAELEQQLKAKPNAAPERIIERIEIPSITTEHERTVDEWVERIGPMMESGVKAINDVAQRFVGLRGLLTVSAAGQNGRKVDSTVHVNKSAKPSPIVNRPPADGDIHLNRLAERKILQVLAQHGPRTIRQLAIQAGYAMGGGGFRGALSKLKGVNYIIPTTDGRMTITGDGTAAIGAVDDLPTGKDLVAYWMSQFNRLAEREVLRIVSEAYPDALPLEEIAARCSPPYEPNGGGFRGAVGKLRTLGLIEGRGEMRMSDDLA